MAGLEDSVITSSFHPWLFSILASILVGLSGIFPLLVIPVETGIKLKGSADGGNMRLLLSFAVGGLLGDVFLHLLPEAWERAHSQDGSAGGVTSLIFWVCTGLFVFAILEKILSSTQESEDPKKNDDATLHNNNTDQSISKSGLSKKAEVAGYLNLIANGIDNFAHGLAVGGSFLVSTRVGCLTTLAILLHEVPHEFADFAILLRSGFTRWQAAKAQLSTASIGLAGALTALAVDSGDELGQRTAWILPFTAGGFLNIALFNVLPDLLESINPKSVKSEVCCFTCGFSIMAAVSYLVE